jgi:hypothetical protein
MDWTDTQPTGAFEMRIVLKIERLAQFVARRADTSKVAATGRY